MIQLCEQSLVFAKMNCLPLGGDVQSANPDSSVLSKRYYFKIWRFNMIFKSYFYLGKLEEALDLLEKQDGLRFVTEKNSKVAHLPFLNILAILYLPS